MDFILSLTMFARLNNVIFAVTYNINLIKLHTVD